MAGLVLMGLVMRQQDDVMSAWHCSLSGSGLQPRRQERSRVCAGVVVLSGIGEYLRASVSRRGTLWCAMPLRTSHVCIPYVYQ